MTSTTTGHVQISARVPIDLAQALEESARDADRTFSAELRRAIKQYLLPQSHRGKAGGGLSKAA